MYINITSFRTVRSASPSKTTGEAEVVVEVNEVRSHSLTRSSSLMRSMRFWADWNMEMEEAEEMEMSALLKRSLVIEYAQSDGE